MPAVDQAIRVLLSLAGSGSSSMSLTAICARVGIHKSKAFSILHTLQRYSLIQKNGRKKGYSLGPGLITMSRRVLDNFNVSVLARPVLERLAEKARGTAILGMIEEDNVFVVAKQEGDRDIDVTVRVGHRFHITYGSHGKAIAAHLPEDELERLLKQDKLYFHGRPENFDRKRLEGEMKRCRRDGFALDLGEMKKGVNTVAAPVLGLNGSPIGYIVVMGLFPVKTARQMGPPVAEAARELSRHLGGRTE